MNQRQFIQLKNAKKKRPIFFTPNVVFFLSIVFIAGAIYFTIKYLSLVKVIRYFLIASGAVMILSMIFRTIQYFRAQYYYSRFPLLVDEIKEMSINTLDEYINLLSDIYSRFGYVPNNYRQFNETVSKSLLKLIDDKTKRYAKILFGEGKSKLVRADDDKIEIIIGMERTNESLYEFKF